MAWESARKSYLAQMATMAMGAKIMPIPIHEGPPKSQNVLPAIDSMQVRAMKRELESYGILTEKFSEKEEFVEALIQARADDRHSKLKTTTSTPQTSTSSSSLSSLSGSSRKSEGSQPRDELESASEQESSNPAEACLTCECCWSDDCRVESICWCTDGHIFCLDCLRHYGEEEVFGKSKTNLKCMSSQGCIAVFPYTVLQRAFPGNRLDKLYDHIGRASVKAAAMQDEWYEFSFSII